MENKKKKKLKAFAHIYNRDYNNIITINGTIYFKLELLFLTEGTEVCSENKTYFTNANYKAYDLYSKSDIDEGYVYCLTEPVPYKSAEINIEALGDYSERTLIVESDCVFIQDTKTLETFKMNDKGEILPIDLDTVESAYESDKLFSSDKVFEKNENNEADFKIVNIQRDLNISKTINPPAPLIVYTDELAAEVKKYIICQDDAVNKLVALIARNLRITDYYKTKKHNALLVGPTGVGKTEMIRVISRLTDIPFFQTSMASYSSTGYVGSCVSSIFDNLFQTYGENSYRAIVFLDEIDKLALNISNSGDVSTTAVQQELLAYLDGRGYQTEVHLDKNKKFNFDVSWLSILGGGAFSDLYKDKDKEKSAIGFQNDEEKENSDELITFSFDELEKFGLKSELIGRLHAKIFLNRFGKEEFCKIMKESKTSSYLEYMKEINEFVTFDTRKFDEYKFIEAVAKRAVEECIGGRSIDASLEYAFEKIMFELYSSKFSSSSKDKYTLYFDHTLLDDNGNYDLVRRR